MLFCYEFKQKFGVFRFKNQTGTETEPVRVDGKIVGFQAKYFDATISGKKDDIIDSLKKAKSKNPALDKILIYTNQEPSESKHKGKKLPTYLIDIEAAAKELNLEIEWRLPSHIEKQLSVPDNAYLGQYFFSPEKGAVEFLENLRKHSEDVLFAVQTAITFKGQEIKLDRDESLSKITSSPSQIVILAGDGGSGKTALVKELMNATKTPFYVMKATEFNAPNIAAIFSQFGAYGITDFLRFHEDEDRKIFVVDSAEKLADLTSLDCFIEFLSALTKDGWKVLFTTRNSYFDDLCFQMVDVYHRSFDDVRLGNLTLDQLESLASERGFELPTDVRLRNLLSNLFYLKEYLGIYSSDSQRMDITKFRESLWRKKIQHSAYRKDNTHIEREKCFINLAKERSDTGNFLLSGQDCSGKILSLLESDEIIKREANHSGYFITHDIYEEWALEKLIETEYTSLLSYESFFSNIGSSLAIRRAFRSWLSDKIFLLTADIRHFVEYSFNSPTIPPFWKEEVLVSILLSDYCTEFFSQFSEELLASGKALLKRIIFLLRTACKEIDMRLQRLLENTGENAVSPVHVFTKTKGKGWEAAIQFICNIVELLAEEELEIILPFLKDWISSNRKGEITRATGLFALHFYKHAELNEKVHYSNEIEQILLQLIMLSSPELKKELLDATNELISEKNVQDWDQPFDSLREAVLTGDDGNFAFIAALPARTIALAKSAWYEREDVEDEYYRYKTGLEHRYGIDSPYRRKYFPASALQTPVLTLLMVSFAETIDFILDFTNRAVETYFASGTDESLKEIELTIEGKKKKQIISPGLWAMYRGSGSPVTPYLLQSMHMALEKKLLEIAKTTDKDVVESWLFYLLISTRSASITAVVTSVVLAYPDKFFEVAKILFSVPEFFWCDSRRLNSESEAKTIYSIGYGFDYRNKEFEDERLATCDDPHRRMCLENLVVNYQFIRSDDVTEEEVEQRQQAIWDILDNISTTISTYELDDDQKKLRLLLGRMDRRIMNPKVTRKGENSIIIELNPDLDEDLKAYGQQAQAAFQETYKHLSLKHWAKHKIEGKELSEDHKRYEEGFNLALEETKTILHNLQHGDERFSFLNREIPAYACAAITKYHRDHLTKDDLSFCEEVILSYAQAPLQEHYRYQIADGVEVAINTLPALYEVTPDSKPDFNLLLLLVLFDDYPLGDYKRVCDYVIEALHELYKISPTDANAILFGYIMLKPKFDADNLPDKRGMQRKSRAEAIWDFVEKYKTELEAICGVQVHYQDLKLNTQNIQTFETAFQIIPADTEDSNHLDYIKKMVERFSGTFFKETRDSRKNDTIVYYKLKHRFFKKFAFFLLHRDLSELSSWTKEIIKTFGPTEETANFLSELVLAEDQTGRYESFWIIWHCFYPVIKGLTQESKSHHLNEIITNYLLAWPWWGDSKEWRSLRQKDTAFFQKVSAEMGQHPTVLYSIAKLLNQIGAPFLEQGIFWIADMLSENPTLQRKQLRPDTIYYLERAARRFVYLNRTKLKTNYMLRSRLVILLDFLVEKGSVNGYLLREDVL